MVIIAPFRGSARELDGELAHGGSRRRSLAPTMTRLRGCSASAGIMTLDRRAPKHPLSLTFPVPLPARDCRASSWRASVVFLLGGDAVRKLRERSVWPPGPSGGYCPKGNPSSAGGDAANYDHIPSGAAMIGKCCRRPPGRIAAAARRAVRRVPGQHQACVEPRSENWMCAQTELAELDHRFGRSHCRVTDDMLIVVRPEQHAGQTR